MGVYEYLGDGQNGVEETGAGICIMGNITVGLLYTSCASRSGVWRAWEVLCLSDYLSDRLTYVGVRRNRDANQ